MKKTFSARRVPRKIGQDEDEQPSPATTEGEEVSEPTIKRPSAKPRKGSSLRTSFAPTAVEDDDAGVVTPKRSNLSRIAVQRNASKRSALLASNLPTRQSDGDEDEDDKPSYTVASLQELKNSTPTTPRDIITDASTSEIEDSTQALDLTSKFGSSLSRYQQQHSSAIPSATEIAEKKARRARLAKEHAAEEYISLDLDDPGLDEDGEEEEDENVMRDENGRLVLKPKDKYGQAESRLSRDDEDVMENFDDFTEAEGRILLGRKAEAEAARKRKVDMAAQIAEAEDHSDSDSDASERERNEAFEAAQTRHGTYGTQATTLNQDASAARPRTPPTISPLPTLDGVIERLRKQISDMQTSCMRKLQEMEALGREKVRLAEEEVRIQGALRETAEKSARLRAERGIEGPVSSGDTTAGLLEAPATAGLGSAAREDGEDMDVEQMDGGHAGLGFCMSARGLESLGASAVGTPAAGADDGDSGSVEPDTMAR
ncbi:hypothetical protein LTR37_003492 [Vermiconidia calcicola]|uniref:Uncharacterized protein n=1 Tax=Vermiconidia calcicola TaxID=1690605 RepID=A0ACC3NRA9_9PEZI|nr:hypothetical protein LTR37_003492 [Vermiconidia calcicola]